ncbi:hypothetical protein R1flu_027273 [Riccia fluitans]|uniref:Uncharacterized protein n=1 Tax=Riccia fluitans TaxID=41844 RepID=A0ABD1XIF6_9MARC
MIIRCNDGPDGRSRDIIETTNKATVGRGHEDTGKYTIARHYTNPPGSRPTSLDLRGKAIGRSDKIIKFGELAKQTDMWRSDRAQANVRTEAARQPAAEHQTKPNTNTNNYFTTNVAESTRADGRSNGHITK